MNYLKLWEFVESLSACGNVLNPIVFVSNSYSIVDTNVDLLIFYPVKVFLPVFSFNFLLYESFCILLWYWEPFILIRICIEYQLVILVLMNFVLIFTLFSSNKGTPCLLNYFFSHCSRLFVVVQQWYGIILH